MTKIKSRLLARPESLLPTKAFGLLGCDAKRHSTAVTLFSFLSQLEIYYLATE